MKKNKRKFYQKSNNRNSQKHGLPSKKTVSSWETSHSWYQKLVGEKGHYYHQQILLPEILKIFQAKNVKSVLDLGCGQGILARSLNSKIEYLGLDVSASLIQEANKLQQKNKQKNKQFIQADICSNLDLKKQDFDLAVFLLSLQNLENGEKAIKNAFQHLKNYGRLLIVLNHPCFRIPRQSDWAFEEKNQKLARRIFSYLSPLKIPIQTAPSKGQKSDLTYSYHSPLSTYSIWLKNCSFYIEQIKELISNKSSSGSRAKAENRARQEIPLFLVITAIKIEPPHA